MHRESERPEDRPCPRAGGDALRFELASGGSAQVLIGRTCDRRDQEPFVAVKRPHRYLATDRGFLAVLIDEARLAAAIAAERRHRLAATAVDGARAEAGIVEDGPIGKIEPGSLAFALAPSAAQPRSAPAKTSAKATPPGTVQGGFTRLP